MCFFSKNNKSSSTLLLDNSQWNPHIWQSKIQRKIWNLPSQSHTNTSVTPCDTPKTFLKHSSCRGRAECIVHKTALVLQSLLLISLGLCGARRFSLTSFKRRFSVTWILALYICSPRFVKAFMDGPSVIPQPHGHFAFHLNSFSLDLESWLNWTEDEIPRQINFLALMLVHSQENCPHSDQGDQRGREETVKIQTSFVSS